MTYVDDTIWELMDFNEKPAAPIVAPIKGECPKCGRKLGKGGHFHVRNCNGDPAKAE